MTPRNQPIRSLNTISENTFSILQGVRQQLASQENLVLTNDTPSIPNSIRLSDALALKTFSSIGMNMYKGALKNEDYGRIWVKKTFTDEKTGEKSDWLVVYTNDEDEIIRQVASEALHEMKKAASIDKTSEDKSFETVEDVAITLNEIFEEAGEYVKPWSEIRMVLNSAKEQFSLKDIIDVIKNGDYETEDKKKMFNIVKTSSQRKFSDEDTSGIQSYFERRKVIRKNQGMSDEEAQNQALEDVSNYFGINIEETKEIVKVAAQPNPKEIPLAPGIKSKDLKLNESGGAGTGTVTIEFTDKDKALKFYQENVVPESGEKEDPKEEEGTTEQPPKTEQPTPPPVQPQPGPQLPQVQPKASSLEKSSAEDAYGQYLYEGDRVRGEDGRRGIINTIKGDEAYVDWDDPRNRENEKIQYRSLSVPVNARTLTKWSNLKPTISEFSDGIKGVKVIREASYDIPKGNMWEISKQVQSSKNTIYSKLSFINENGIEIPITIPLNIKVGEMFERPDDHELVRFAGWIEKKAEDKSFETVEDVAITLNEIFEEAGEYVKPWSEIRMVLNSAKEQFSLKDIIDVIKNGDYETEDKKKMFNIVKTSSQKTAVKDNGEPEDDKMNKEDWDKLGEDDYNEDDAIDDVINEDEDSKGEASIDIHIEADPECIDKIIDSILEGTDLDEDQLEGGKGDNKSEDEFDPDQLEKGKEVEKEHTDNEDIAEEISKDHLTEMDDYYDKLEDMEGKGKKKESSLEKSSVHPNLGVWVATLGNKLPEDQLSQLHNILNQFLPEQNGRDYFEIVRGIEALPRDQKQRLETTLQEMLGISPYASLEKKATSPPGRKHEVEELKEKGVPEDEAFAIAWKQYNEKGEPKKESSISIDEKQEYTDRYNKKHKTRFTVKDLYTAVDIDEDTLKKKNIDYSKRGKDIYIHPLDKKQLNKESSLTFSNTKLSFDDPYNTQSDFYNDQGAYDKFLNEPDDLYDSSGDHGDELESIGVGDSVKVTDPTSDQFGMTGNVVDSLEFNSFRVNINGEDYHFYRDELEKTSSKTAARYIEEMYSKLLPQFLEFISPNTVTQLVEDERENQALTEAVSDFFWRKLAGEYSENEANIFQRLLRRDYKLGKIAADISDQIPPMSTVTDESKTEKPDPNAQSLPPKPSLNNQPGDVLYDSNKEQQGQGKFQITTDPMEKEITVKFIDEEKALNEAINEGAGMVPQPLPQPGQQQTQFPQPGQGQQPQKQFEDTNSQVSF